MKKAIYIGYDSNGDCGVMQKTITGRLTKKRYIAIQRYIRKKSKSYNNCGCSHDCCGCLSSVCLTAEYFSNKIVITQREYFNF